MTLIVRFFLYAILVISYSVYASDSLRFIGEANIPTGEKFQETEIGGLSGITFDSETNRILAISDDRSFVNEARFYEFDLAINEKSFSVKPAKVVKLKNKNGEFFKPGVVDFEGITFYGKDILASSEGLTNSPEPTVPELYLFSRNGDFKELVTIPEKFLLPNKNNPQDKMYGSRDNKAFESLSTSLDGKTTFMASEDAIFQDGPITTVSYGAHVRVILYQNLKPTSEVAYEIEKIENMKNADPAAGDNGLVDIAAIDSKNFYTMERSYLLPPINKNIIRIFKCQITTSTTDVSKMDSLKGAAFKPVEKTLVANLDDYLPLLNPGRLDNIEGITFGPVLANGKRSLIVVSDNNFNKGQRTLFMAFEIK